MLCPSCNGNIPDNSKFCTSCGANLAQIPVAAPVTAAADNYANAPVENYATVSQGVNFDFSSNTATSAPTNRKFYEYKVLSQKDKWLSGKFDPLVLEQAINAYAQQGWRVIGCATADIPGFGTARQEFITLLEREL